jgi:hypothetical protein
MKLLLRNVSSEDIAHKGLDSHSFLSCAETFCLVRVLTPSGIVLWDTRAKSFDRRAALLFLLLFGSRSLAERSN